MYLYGLYWGLVVTSNGYSPHSLYIVSYWNRSLFEADEMVCHNYPYKTLKLHLKYDSVSTHLNICLPRHGSDVLF